MLNCYCQLSSSVIFRQYGVSQSECKIDRPRPGLPRVSTRPHTEALGTRLVIDVNECFHDFMLVNRAQPPPPPPPASVNLVLQHGAKPCKVSIALFVDYSYYSSTIRGLFVLFVDYSRTIRTIRRLFALFALFASLF